MGTRERIRRLKRTTATALAVGSAAAVVLAAQSGPWAPRPAAAAQIPRSTATKTGTARGFYVSSGSVSVSASREDPVASAYVD